MEGEVGASRPARDGPPLPWFIGDDGDREQRADERQERSVDRVRVEPLGQGDEQRGRPLPGRDQRAVLRLHPEHAERPGDVDLDADADPVVQAPAQPRLDVTTAGPNSDSEPVTRLSRKAAFSPAGIWDASSSAATADGWAPLSASMAGGVPAWSA